MTLELHSSGWRPCLPCLLFVLRRSGDLSEELKNPIPSRTRPLNSSAPMVLCLKTRESRSLPGLPRTNTTPLYTIFDNQTAVSRLERRGLCLCPSPSKPASKAILGAGWSSPVARQAHNLKVAGSNPVPATKHNTTNKAPGAEHARGLRAFRAQESSLTNISVCGSSAMKKPSVLLQGRLH